MRSTAGFGRRGIAAWVLAAAIPLPGLTAPAAGPRPAARQDPGWWSFRPPVLPRVPDVRRPGAKPAPIDAFVLARLQKAALVPAPEADRRTLIRRLYLDLVGLPPPTERVEKFAADSASDAWPKLIDELLASPHYGERWGRHWLDVARYADTGGYETDIYYRSAWRYRDYVIRAFNEDRPYNRFVQEQIAGDEIWPDDLALEGSYQVPERKKKALEARIGTGLFTLGPQIHESNMDGRKLRYEWLTDAADTTGSAFLGLTLGCARCHDHKADPITQRDYYAFQAIFAASRETETPVIDGMGIADARQHYPRVLAVEEARAALESFQQRTANRALSPAEQQERARLLEALAAAVLAAPKQTAQGQPFTGLLEIPTAAVLGHVAPALVTQVRRLDRGELSRPREPVGPDVPAVLREAAGPPFRFDNPFARRKRLAQWLARPDHPLTARVIVNRVWGWHFGEGLVATPNDFGRMGRPPSHPELLDWLAVTFATPVEKGGCGWSLKRLHRLILNTEAYRRSSAHTDDRAYRADPQNRLLWRMNRRRLEGEALWDAIHSVAGTLNLKAGGRPVMPPLTEEELGALRDRWHWVVPADPAEHRRRAVYLLVRRNFRFPFLEAFDAPVNSVSCPRRDVTTVAPQALWFLNNRTSMEQARAFAGRLVKEAGPDAADAALVERAWRLALGRPPDADERGEAAALLREGGADRGEALARFCLALFNLNEFVFVD